MQNFYKTYYKNILCEDLILKESIANVFAIPSISTITISHSSGQIAKNPQFAIPGLASLELIAGQKSQITKTKKSISQFQTRTNQLIGCKVTLRKSQLFPFLEKFTFFILPRMNTLYDGTPLKSVYNFGMDQLLIFPELENYYESFDFLKGCHLHITTSAQSKEACHLLLTGFKILPNNTEF